MIKILIAEDDLTSRTILSSMVEKWDFEPIEVDNGKRALEDLIKEDAPTLALLDWSMPEMDGLEVIQNIRCRANFEQPYIIFVTAKADKEDVMKRALIADNLNWISVDDIDKPLKLMAKIRYNHKKVKATVTKLGDDSVRVDFEDPQFAPTPGQAVVFYDKDVVVGGGWIREAL